MSTASTSEDPFEGGELLVGRRVALNGERDVLRLLPHRRRSTVGAFCFIDLYWPHPATGARAMAVGPHPHTGIDTVSWLFEGTVEHRDSLGNVARTVPGARNLMRAGRGITHAEQSPREATGMLHDLQLWVALRDEQRHEAPAFSHLAEVPRCAGEGFEGHAFLGALATTSTPTAPPPEDGIVALDLILGGNEALLPLEGTFEHGLLAVSGEVLLGAQHLVPGSLCYLPAGLGALTLRATPGSRLVVLGGTPFTEELVMWWNFVGRSDEEIRNDLADWQQGRRFGEVHGASAAPSAAPRLPSARVLPRRSPGGSGL